MSGSRGGQGQARILCKVEGCGRDLAEEKDYYRRYKVCQAHASDPCVIVRGQQQRFCQQCGTFHGVSEFDLDKRSCRHALSLHNIKRRKRAPDGGAGGGAPTLGGSQRRRSAYAAPSGEQTAAKGQDADGSNDDPRLDAAARFEAVAAALRRGEGLHGLLPQGSTGAGAGAYQHPSLGTSSLPPRWRVPGLERASGSSGGSGDATLFRSVSDNPADAQAAAAAAVAAGFLPPSALPPGYNGGSGAQQYPSGRLLTSSAPQPSMAELMAEIAANEYAASGGGGPLVQRAAQVAAAAAAAASGGPSSDANAAQALTPEDYTAIVAAAMAAQAQQPHLQPSAEQASGRAGEEGGAAAGSPQRRASAERKQEGGAAATPPRPQPMVTMELTEHEAELIRAHRGRAGGGSGRALTDVAASLQLLSGAGGSGEAGASATDNSLRRSSAFQPYGGGRSTPPPGSTAAVAGSGSGQWPLDVLQLGLARAAAARSDPTAVQAMAEAIRRQVPSGDLWHAALMQPQAQGPPSASKPPS